MPKLFTKATCVVFCLALSNAIASADTSIFSTFSGANGFDPGTSSPPYTLGPGSNPSKEIQWAMPFQTTSYERLTKVRIAMAHQDGSVPPEPQTDSNMYIFVVQNAVVNGIDQPPTQEFWDSILYSGSIYSSNIPYCRTDCAANPNCASCIPAPTSSEDAPIIEIAIPSDPAVYLPPGKYWLIFGRYDDFATPSYWYRAGLSAAFTTAYSRQVGDLYDTQTTWNADLGVPAAFEIFVATVPCTLPSASVNLPTGCNQPTVSTANSTCWFAPDTLFTQLPDQPSGAFRGYPLNLNLWQGFGPSDYPPKSLVPELSSLPLVSKGVAHFGGPSPFLSRPMHNDVIDIITGQPLIQATDFELPFGGAVFRHIRTYSENSGQIQLLVSESEAGQPTDGTFWDWNGRFWMMGENPILLIDASYRDALGNPIIHPDTKRCYLIPDAHHAIPFLSQGSSYVAPSWFDAQLMPSTSMVNVDGVNRPTHYYCWLNRKSIKYTFKAHYEDGWIRVNGHNAHKPPSEGGLGIPYYGIIEKIEDAYGNCIEYEFCSFEQTEIGSSPPIDAGHGCKRCRQNCNEKGQIKAIRLKSGGDTVWTLVYTHRAFPVPTIPMPTEGTEVIVPFELRDDFHQHHLHSINVFKGNIPPQDLPACLTIPSEQFCRTPGSSTGNRVAALNDIDGIEHAWLSSHANWVIEAKYMYSEEGFLRGGSNQTPPVYELAEDLCENARLFGDASATYDSEGPPERSRVGLRLMKTTVTRKQDSGEIDKKYTLYRDAPTSSGGAEDRNGFSILKFIYESDTVARILAAKQLAEPQLARPNPNFLFGVRTTSIDTTVEGEPQLPTDVAIIDPESGLPVTKSLASLADIVLTDFSETLPEYEDSFHSSPETYLALTGTYANSGPGYTRFNHVTRRRRLIDRRPSQKQTGEFRFYYLVQFPENFQPPNDPVTHRQIYYHFPYQFHNPVDMGDYSLHRAPLDHPFFVTIIDELLSEGGSYDPSATIPSGVRTRRVVEMNAAGFVLQDRTWSFEGGVGQITSHLEFAESYKRDCLGRVVQKRSRGWGAGVANGGDGLEEGLIEVFQYEDDHCGWDTGIDGCDCSTAIIGDTPGVYSASPKELIATGIKKGTTGPLLYRTRVERTAQGHPELITKQITFPVPTSDPESPSAEVTTTDYVLVPDPNDENLTRVVQKTVIGPPAPQTRGGAMVYPVEKFHYDASGNLDWHGTGLLDGPAPSSGIVLFTMNSTERNDMGQTTKSIIDVGGTVPQPPDGWTRVHPASALNQTTEFRYEVPHGLYRIIYPNDRESWIVNLPYPEGSKQVQFSDLVPITGGYKALSAGKIRTMRGDSLVSEETVRFDVIEGVPDGHDLDEGDYVTLSVATPSYDEHGRIIGMQQSGAPGSSNSISASLGYDEYGNINRQVEPDGTITRNVYDGQGRLARVYRGTNDEHAYWNTARLCLEGEIPEEDNCVLEFGDDLVLIEKRYYGTQVTNAGELEETRSYRDQPTNQYHYIPPVDPPEPNNEDDIGSLKRHYYDWRMRPVVVQQINEGGSFLAHTYTWLDNLDRPRLIAEYGSEAPADPNPKNHYDQDVPVASSILGASIPPTELVENIYNSRGQVEEVRRYDVSDSSGNKYTSTLTFYDHAGRSIEVHAPNSPIRRNEYDGKGRLVAARSYAGSVEVSRTETEYNGDDRAIISTTYHRTHSSTTGELDENNAIRTYSHTWYDLTGRVLATANFGTNSETDQYIGAEGPDYLPDAPVVRENPLAPVTGCSYGLVGTTALPAQLTCYAYDEAGRQTKVWRPDHTLLETEYDDLGRTKVTIDNAGSPDHQRTEYEYDDETGQLVTMKAVISGGTNQVTEFIYGASVVDSSDDQAAISNNNSWIREVRFPDGQTGLPSTTDILTFTYYPNGAVASRTDPRGIIFKHWYDDLGRRTETEVDDQAWYPPPDPNQTSLWPPNRIRRIKYEYNNKNLLELITAYRVHHGLEVLFCQNKYEYDSAGRLFREWQAHEDPVNGETPFVQYNWQSSSYLLNPSSAGSGYNFERLGGIVYPRLVGGTTGRTISYSYGGSPDDVDGRLSRITQVGDNKFPSTPLVNQYEYCGVAQRIRSVFGSLTQSYTDEQGYPSLDRFGRVKDLNFQKADEYPLLRYQYGYHPWSGNRIFARITHQPTVVQGQTIPHDNDRSYLYAYDSLNRLISAEMGQLNGNNTAINPASGGVPLPTKSTWTLDNLGNWTGDAESPGLRQTGDVYGNGANVTVNTTHFVDHANRIGGIAHDFPPTNATINMNDVAGNLASDGIYYYQYDAWNRLVQVNEMGTAWLGADGRPSMGQLGPVVARYAYDGLGRLIRKQSAVNTGQTYIQSKDFYYDGVRRIQEVIFRPPLGSGLFEPEHGNDEGIILPSEPIDPTAITQIILGADPGSVKGNVGYLWTDREYVYDPAGDVDAFIYQVDKHNRVMYMLQDANLNVVGLVAGPTTANPTQYPWPAVGTLLEQYVYEPYGKVIKSDSFHVHPVNRVGHQGLFFERYDADFGDQTLAGSANGLYYNRNRFYHPVLGRFTTRDPNESGMPILAALATNGEAIEVAFGGFNGQSLYGDGLNLYAFVKSNPINDNDPAGLFSLLGMTATQQLQMDMNGQTADMGIGILQAMEGLIGQINHQNIILSDMLATSPSQIGNEFDTVLAVFAAIQSARNASLAGGILKAGVKGASLGFRKFAKGTLRDGVGFKSFKDLKKFLGDPGSGKVWHHIVEQNQIKKFGAARIHNTKNVMSIDWSLNVKLNNYYNSKRPFSQNMTVREWLKKTKSFDEQYQFGLEKLREFGGL